MLRNHWIGKGLRRAIPKRWRPVGLLTHLAQQRTGRRVLSGPFEGMAYIDKAFSSAHLPKLLGIYERELHRVIEKACALAPEVVVDIGAAEGYYAVGFALRLPHARVIAFEMDKEAQHALSDLTAQNDVTARVELHDECDVAQLEAALASGRRTQNDHSFRALVICDAEGAERQVLDPTFAPALLAAYVLVELHPRPSDDIGAILRGRFAATHNITAFVQEPRTAADFPFHTALTYLLPHICIEWGVSEWRPARMSWLWMEPKAQ